MKVVVASIALNEAKHVRRWAESAKDADYIYLLDTGSTDDTVKIAKECGVTVIEQKITPWHFANARNYLLERLPEDADWVINLDLDEVLIDGWRGHLEQVPAGITRPRYQYTWNWDADGKPGLQYHGDKIVVRHGYKWHGAVHEVMHEVAPLKETQCFIGLEIHHHADNTKSRGSYLPLLLLDVEENPDNDRNVYYCARELMYYGRVEESVAMFKRHLTMPSSIWPPERAFSMRYIAKQMPEEAEHWLLRGCAEYPWGRELWVDLASHYHDKHNWAGCYYAAKRALSLTDRGSLYLTESVMWGWFPHDLMALAAYNLGLYDEAYHHGKIACELNPSDTRLKSNLLFYMLRQTKINVVIPTKSNIAGLTRIVNQVLSDPMVGKLIIVADGSEAYNNLNAIPNFNHVVKVMVNEGSGIHAMWNLGMNIAGYDGPVVFINDDVSIDKQCLSELAVELVKNPEYGLICPSYSKTAMSESVEVFDTCRGRYDGTGGMAGFCMMLAKDLVPRFRFDENMKWWYGDDELVDWVIGNNRKCVISAATWCEHDHSKTVELDPPKDFAAIVANDKKIYEGKKNA